MSLQPSPPEAIRLPAQCGTAAAPALHAALLHASTAGAAPVIDAGEVESLGQAVLQLLLAGRAAMPDMIIAPVSPAFAERAGALQVANALGLDAGAAR